MVYSEMFKTNAKVVLSNSYALELALEEGSDIVGRWIADRKNVAKTKEEYDKLDKLYSMWILENR